MASKEILTARQREILIKTLETYISTGVPVSSASLVDAVDTSSSTIRAELNALEAQGLLTHPHTSAGRIPTDAGYRFYVDYLLSEGTTSNPAFVTPEGYGNVDDLLQDVSEGMSEVTSLLAVVAGPSALGESVFHVDYLPFGGDGGFLLVVTTESGLASSTRISLPLEVEEGELRDILSALNGWLGGRPLDGDLELSRVARRVLSDHNPHVVGAVLQAVEVLGQASGRGVFVRGASALLARLDDLDPASLSTVVEIFERRRWLLHLIGDSLRRSVLDPGGLIVAIGAESGFRRLTGTSLVAAAYNHRERPCGVVSLIGPKRMDYDAAISTVRSAAESLTLYLNARF